MTKYSVRADRGNSFYLACLASIEHACGIKVSKEKSAKTDVFEVNFFAQPDQYRRIMDAFQPKDLDRARETRNCITGYCYAMGNK